MARYKTTNREWPKMCSMLKNADVLILYFYCNRYQVHRTARIIRAGGWASVTAHLHQIHHKQARRKARAAHPRSLCTLLMPLHVLSHA